jgi:hypothetical protein
MNEILTCPKCNVESGDDWSSCEKSCPMPMSPWFDPTSLHVDEARRRIAFVNTCESNRNARMCRNRSSISSIDSNFESKNNY